MKCKKIIVSYTLTDTEYRARIAAGGMDGPVLTVAIPVLDLSPDARVALLDLQSCGDWADCIPTSCTVADGADGPTCRWPVKVAGVPIAEELSARLLALQPLHIAARAAAIAAEEQREREHVAFLAKREADQARQKIRDAECEAVEARARADTAEWLRAHCPADIVERYEAGVLPAADRHAAVRDVMASWDLGTPWEGPTNQWAVPAQEVTAQAWAALAAVRNRMAEIPAHGAGLRGPEVCSLRAHDGAGWASEDDDSEEVIVIGLLLPDGVETRLRLAI